MILIDADAYIGIYIVDDNNHAKAIELLSELQQKKEQVVTTWEAIDEVVTKVSHHISQSIARKFLDDIIHSDTHIEYMYSALVQPVKTLFFKQTSKKVSLTDCVNMVIARSLGIKTFFSFDHHYEQNGFTLLAKRS